MIALASVALLAWLYLLLGHGRFWQAGPALAPSRPSATPDVDIVISPPATRRRASRRRCARCWRRTILGRCM